MGLAVPNFAAVNALELASQGNDPSTHIEVLLELASQE
jgi:hypothetical protein